MAASNVLYVSPCSERAGAEQLTKLFILNHSPEWKPSIVFFKEGPFVNELRELGVTCFVFPPELKVRLRNPASFYEGVHFISQLIEREKIDLVHSVMGYGHLLGGAAALKSKRAEVWYQHGPTGPLDYLTGRVSTDCILTNSRFTYESQKKYFARTPGMKLIYPANGQLHSIVKSEEARKRFGLTEGENVFGLAGRMSPMKGQLQFVEAAVKLLEIHPTTRFMLIGSSFENHQSDYEKAVYQKINESKFSERFICTGYLPDPKVAMQACDVIVNATTIAEPFGLTLIEAMQLGKPVIAPAQGGPLEIIDSGKDGLFFSPGDVMSLQIQMKRMIEAKKEAITWDQYRKAAKDKAESKFNLNRMMKELEAEYTKVMSKRT